MYESLADIPRFPQAHYSVHVDLDSLADALDRYVNDLGLDMNPDFQRGHVWSEHQASRYVEFILQGGESGRTIIFNHPGWMSSYEGDFVLVDGLQRLTALRGFLEDRVPVFGKHLSDYKGGLRGANSTLLFSISKLKTRAEVLDWYLALNSGGTPHNEAELRRVRELRDLEGV